MDRHALRPIAPDDSNSAMRRSIHRARCPPISQGRVSSNEFAYQTHSCLRSQSSNSRTRHQCDRTCCRPSVMKPSPIQGSGSVRARKPHPRHIMPLTSNKHSNTRHCTWCRLPRLPMHHLHSSARLPRENQPAWICTNRRASCNCSSRNSKRRQRAQQHQRMQQYA